MTAAAKIWTNMGGSALGRETTPVNITFERRVL